jgi:putative Ca2+/H+ antiporter (TMEM165/GDT1 family)
MMLDLLSFGAVAATLFVAELTDKDAFLLITLATRASPVAVFLAGAAAFTFTTIVLVVAGSFLVVLVPVYWIRLAGGLVMVGYALWEARGLVGLASVEEQESKVRQATTPWRAFAAMVAALVLLDLAGDATEVLIIVFVAHYGDLLFVFASVLLGLLCATALETALGNRLGKFLTPARLRVVSVAVFLLLGTSVLLFNAA